MFKEIKNRDAWSTIRGFVYQVDLTILRWLDLKSNEVLELEKGEDIDIVTRDLSNQEISRDLEQVKYREGGLSLNQTEVLELLLNFFIHKKNNPSNRILYRFITNTSYVLERPALFVKSKSGIETWNELRNIKDLKIDDKRLIKIKTHLTQKINKKISEESELKKDWIAFNELIEDEKKLIGFIKDFEWSFNNENIEQIANRVKNKISDNFSTEIDSTELIYSRLFLFVFKLLCKKELKQLDEEKLNIQAALPKLDSSDLEVLEILNKLLFDIDGRITILEDKVAINSGKIAELVGDAKLIANSNAVFEYKVKNLSIKSPPVIRNGSLREKKVETILNYFNSYSWVGFQGINGTGKSQLASLISQKFESYYWLDLRAYNQDLEKSSALLEAFLSIISKKNINHIRSFWLDNIISSVPNNTLIILNDIPKIELGTSFGDLFVLIVNKFENSKIKLLTTSNYKVTEPIKPSISDSSLIEIDKFEFSDEEIKEYLKNIKANEYVHDYIDLIASFSKRNPRLLSGILNHLKSIDWGEKSTDIFDTLLKKNFTDGILDDSQLLIKKFISNNDSKELLYRLSLIYWDFDFTTVKLVSNINLKIPHPYERLQDLLNLWIQESNDKLFNVSPLISEIGKKKLSDDTIQNIHLAIANSIIQDGLIDEINASKMYNFFFKW